MKNFLTLILIVSGIAACSTLGVNLPSITEGATTDRLPGKIVWRDLLTNDPEGSKRFYGELFGWQFESVGSAANLGNNSDYTLIRHNGRLIGGMVDTVALNDRDDISQWIIFMSVADVEAEVAAVAAAGGEIVTPPVDLQRRGKLAIIRDVEGAMFGLLQSRDGDPEDQVPEIGDFLWDELWTTDVSSAVGLYEEVGQLKAGAPENAAASSIAETYRVLRSGETPRVGVMPRPLEDLPPVWVTYIRSADPAAITARVADLGGRVIVEAQPRAVGGEAAFIAGPSGAGIALQTWPLDQDN